MAIREGIPFGALLRRLRLASGLTQEGLAERAGISAKAVSDLERHPERIPRLETIVLLADALGLDPEARSSLLAAARPESRIVTEQSRDHTRPPSMPHTLTPLVGRAEDIAAVTALLRERECRLVTLTGPGGVGKTRLAIQVGDDLSDHFAGRVLFVDLAPLRDANLVLSTVAHTLDVSEGGGKAIHEALIGYLQEKALLLVLDNFEQVLGASDNLLHLLQSCPGVQVLVTSREPLHVQGEQIYRVAPLALPDTVAITEAALLSPAVQLFLQRAGSRAIDVPEDAVNAPAVIDICRRLDGLPLAIELAAAWLSILPVPALLDRLDHRLPLLVGGPRDLPARQQTIRDTVAWSYDLLDAPERAVFRRLGVFVGGCALDAAVKVLGDGRDAMEVLRSLRALEEKNLVRPEQVDREVRLRMLETIREYSVERLEAEDNVPVIRRRHAEHCLELAQAFSRERAGPQSTTWMERLEREHDNLRAALQWALNEGDASVALGLAGSIWPFWLRRGYLTEARGWIRAVLAMQADELSCFRLETLRGAATLAINQGDYGEAEMLCAACVALARGSGARESLVEALNTHGLLARQAGRYEEATQWHGEALVLAREVGHRSGEGVALCGLAITASFTGDIAGGHEVGEQGLAIFREIGDEHGIAEVLSGLALESNVLGEYDAAEAYGKEALAIFRRLNDTGNIAGALFSLGATAQSKGQYERAAALLEESLEIRLERGDEHSSAASRGALAQVALQVGQYGRAHDLLAEAFRIAQKYDDPWDRAMITAILGHVDLATGNTRHAQQMFGESAALFQAIGNVLFLPWSVEGLVQLWAAKGNWHRVARLIGARDVLCIRTRGRNTTSYAYPAAYKAALAIVRETLDEDAFLREYRVGETMELEAILAEAMRDEQDPEALAGA